MFALLYVVSISAAVFVTYFSQICDTISTVAMGNSIISVVLYICQRTFLSTFHPGHANFSDVLGLVLVIFGTAVMPLIFSFSTHRDKDSSN